MVARSFILAVAWLAVAVTASMAEIHALLVRSPEGDALVLRPWLTEPSTTGVWLWPVPAGTRVAVRGDLGLAGMHSAVWMGHRPLSEVNAIRFGTYCLLNSRGTQPTVPLVVLGEMTSVEELTAAAAGLGIALPSESVTRCAEILANGAHAAAVAWIDWRSETRGDVTPLDAVVLTRDRWDVIDIAGENRGCTGSLIAVAPLPVLPGPEDRGRWQASLLVGSAAVGALDVARAVVGEVMPDWSVSVMGLERCDGQTWLNPVTLDLACDPPAAMGRAAASWCGLHPDGDSAEALRRALVDTTRLDESMAYNVWAWSHQATADLISVLVPWTRAAENSLARCEALLAVAAADTASASSWYAEVLAAFPEASKYSEQPTLDFAGRRLVCEPTLIDDGKLRRIASYQHGWDDWLTENRRTEPPTTGLTGGVWAVAALAAHHDANALDTLNRALVASASRNQSRVTRRDPAAAAHQSWCGSMILQPETSAKLWPTLHRVQLVLGDRPAVRDSVLRRALRDDHLPETAAMVMLASLEDWQPQDEARAAAALAAVDSSTRDVAAAAAYALAQRKVTAPILAMVARDLPPELRGEFIYALVLSRAHKESVSREVTRWRADAATMDQDSSGTTARSEVTRRIEELRALGRTPGRWPAPRFAYEFRQPWWPR